MSDTKTRDQHRLIGQIMASKDFTPGEKRVLEYQLTSADEREGFTYSLMKAIHVADNANQAKLALAFPSEVAAVQRWQRGDLATVWRKMGLSI